MQKWIYQTLVILMLWIGQSAHADFLPPDQAFQFNAVSISQNQAELTWTIADGYYLYHDQTKVVHDQKPLQLNLPKPQAKDDPNFGMTQVHYHKLKTSIEVQPNQSFQVQWQGCAESGLCYPIQTTTIKTDADGLLPAQQLAQNQNKIKINLTPDELERDSSQSLAVTENANSKNESSVIEGEKNSDSEVAETTLVNDLTADKPTDTENTDSPTKQDQASASQPIILEQDLTQADERNVQWNNDQYFLNLLSGQSVWLNLAVFLGLGILLAFLPCSLPLIPILSGILVQNYRGYRAAVIALVFIIGMAIVYALMGFVVSQLGYSFQRWFQSPIFIGIFSVLFVLFALNLFGAFQLSLPQGLLQKLDEWQQRQKGGTLIGAGLMGMIAALIVGPCMSAPLAGALIYVSQVNQPLIGASLLFVLGLGGGLPLFIAAVFGTKYLPKPGKGSGWIDLNSVLVL